MGQDRAAAGFPTVGDGSGFADTDQVFREELQLALRNRGMLLEGLRYPITPTGMHYLLVHYDIPEVNVDEWRLKIGGLVSGEKEGEKEVQKEVPPISRSLEAPERGSTHFAKS